MSLEQKIETLTTEIVALREVIGGLIANGGAASAGTTTTAADSKADAKGGAKGGKGGKSSSTATEAKAEEKPASVHSLADLQKVLGDYKEVFGMAKAKKLLPDMGYENSKAVPADKIDEVFDAVTALLEEEANNGGGEL